MTELNENTALQINTIASYFDQVKTAKENPQAKAMQNAYIEPTAKSQIVDLTKINDPKVSDWAKESIKDGAQFAIIVTGHGVTALLTISKHLTTEPLSLENYGLFGDGKGEFTFDDLKFAKKFSTYACNNHYFHLNLIDAPKYLIVEGTIDFTDAVVDADTIKESAQSYVDADAEVEVPFESFDIDTNHDIYAKLRNISESGQVSGQPVVGRLMNDFEKAKAVIIDRNNSLPNISKKLGISLDTLKKYRHDPDKLQTAAWKRVHEIAKLYGEVVK